MRRLDLRPVWHSDHAQHVSGLELHPTESKGFSSNLPPGVARANGMFYLADAPGEQVILQVAGRRLEWQRGEPWGDARPYSRLVLIGPRALVDEESLRAGLSVLLTPTRPIE